MTGRSVEEWIGKTPDTPIPARVRLRVFEAHGGRCAETGIKIRAGDAWDVDHRIPLTLGGENRESNLQPLLREVHRKKTALDVAAKAKAARVRKKFLGIESPSKQRLPGSKGSKWKRTVGGRTVLREGN